MFSSIKSIEECVGKLLDSLNYELKSIERFNGVIEYLEYIVGLGKEEIDFNSIPWMHPDKALNLTERIKDYYRKDPEKVRELVQDHIEDSIFVIAPMLTDEYKSRELKC